MYNNIIVCIGYNNYVHYLRIKSDIALSESALADWYCSMWVIMDDKIAIHTVQNILTVTATYSFDVTCVCQTFIDSSNGEYVLKVWINICNYITHVKAGRSNHATPIGVNWGGELGV
jgi:hypothetical protein